MQFKTKNLIDVEPVVDKISAVVPIGLLLLALLSFIAVGIFTVDYYEELFSIRFKGAALAMAILVSCIQELVRFGLLVASIRDFSTGAKLVGWFGLFGSIGLVSHDISVAYKIAEMWSPSNPLPYSGVFLFLILIGLLLEIRLIGLLSNKSNKKEVEHFSFNGATSTPNGVGRSVGEASRLS